MLLLLRNFYLQLDVDDFLNTLKLNLPIMKYFFYLVALSLFLAEIVAFPSHMFDLSMDEEEKRNIANIATSIEADAKTRRAGTPIAPGFDASQQYVSNKGAHAFVPPGPNDLRGPCPGLNAMANHAYIPHNGVATITEFIQGTYDGEHS
jgi:Peroxidase, family 2